MSAAVKPARTGSAFSSRIIAWQRRHGRHDLPWQRSRDPYRIWLSEIMLQQTQVTTVIPYFERFVARFPHVHALAAAPIEAVMACWAGLGYYSRARNLHRCAQHVVDLHGGRFPHSAAALVLLPGIGRSTAAAIAAFAYGEQAAILEGNVKRVLARHFGIEGYPGVPDVQRVFWQRAESLLPGDGIEAYTQGLMDLGATVCTRTRPVCAACPVNDTCIARRERTIHRLPTPRPLKQRPVRSAVVLVLRTEDGALMFEQRPPAGIWGGLFSLPEFNAAATDAAIVDEVAARYGMQIEIKEALGQIKHEFTHYTLMMQPRVAHLTGATAIGSTTLHAVNESELQAVPLPAPIRRLLLKLSQPALV